MKEKKYNEWLQDVIGDIDDELLLETEELRNRKFLSNYQKIQNDIEIKSAKENDIKKSQSKMTNYFNQQTKKYNTEKENEIIQESYQEDDIEENSRELFFHQENKSEKQFVQESLSQELKENKKVKRRNNIWKTMGTLVACVSIFFIGSFCWKIGLFENYASDNIQNENAMYVTEQVECEQWQDEERDFENEPQNRSDNSVEQNIKDTSELADKN